MSGSTRPMPSFEKSSPALVARFEAVAARHPEARRKPMFGYPALFVGGNYATGLYEESWVVRLGGRLRQTVVADSNKGKPFRGLEI